MVPSMSSFTVLFQSPFWVGIAQRWGEEGYQAAKITFGAQPTDTQIYQWVLKEWHRLVFSKLSEEESPVLERKQKRLQREARKAIQVRGIGTKAQAALALQREDRGLARREKKHLERQEEDRRKFLLRQQKKARKKAGQIILPRFLNVANVILEGKRLVRPLQWSVSRGGQASLSAGTDFLLQPSPWMTWRETVL